MCHNLSLSLYLYLYINSPVCALSRSLGPSISVLDINVVGVNTVMYFRNCKILLSGIDSIESFTNFSIEAVGTTITNLSITLINDLAIAKFNENSENSVRQINPSFISGSASDPGLNLHIT